MKKVSLVFATRKALWAFLNISQGVNVSLHQKVYCLTGNFPEGEIEQAVGQYQAQVFENIFAEAPPPPPAEKPVAQFSFSPAFLIL